MTLILPPLPPRPAQNVDVMTLTDPEAYLRHVLGTKFEMVPDVEDLVVADAEIAYLRPRLRLIQGGGERFPSAPAPTPTLDPCA